MRHTRCHLRRAWLTGLLMALAVPAVSRASAPTVSQPTAEAYRYVAVIAGDCERLVLSGDDHTSGCSDRLVNVDFGDGRVAFVFTTPSARGAIVTTFLGRTSTQGDLRTYRLDVDEVTTTTTDAAGDPTNVVESAAGHCAMTGDPTHERARFECEADRPSGRTAATFLSTGTPTVYAGTRDDAGPVAANPTR